LIPVQHVKCGDSFESSLHNIMLPLKKSKAQ
jgi:hypothetical protein